MDFVDLMFSFGEPQKFENMKYDRNILNKNLITVVPSAANAERINALFDYVYQMSFNQTTICPSGCISTHRVNIPKQKTSFLVEDVAGDGKRITVLCGCYGWRLQFGGTLTKDGKAISAQSCWSKFKKACKDKNIKLDKYKVSPEEGLLTKTLIPAPHVKAYVTNKVEDPFMQHCHYLDFHQAYLGCLPSEFQPIKEYISAKRKEDESWKLVGNVAIGWCQRKSHPVFAPLSLKTLSEFHNRMESVLKALTDAGYKVLLTRTDGIWYTNGTPEPFHDHSFFSFEGTHPGQWQNQIVDVPLRIKSAGAYEYFDEDGQLVIKLCGQTKLDQTKPRCDWKPDDLFNPSAAPYVWRLTNNEGHYHLEQRNQDVLELITTYQLLSGE